MAAVLIAVILVLVLGHAAPQLAALRRFGWFADWLEWVVGHGGGWARSRAGVLLSIGVPVALLAALQAVLAGRGYGLPAFVLAVVVLFWCWGPRDLDLDAEAVLDAPDRERKQVAAQALLGTETLPPLNGAVLVEGVFRGALERWFAVLLWFLLLGPAGALLYRLAQLAAQPSLQAMLPPVHAATVLRLRAILEWPVAQLTVLSLALVANFDTVIAAWRDWYAAQGKRWSSLDSGFLGAVALASVDCELIEDEAYDPVENPPPALLELRDALSLAWRILLLWLTALALAVLAGFVN